MGTPSIALGIGPRRGSHTGRAIAAPYGLKAGCPAGVGGAPRTLAPTDYDDKRHADSAEQPGRHLDSPHLGATGQGLPSSPPSRSPSHGTHAQMRPLVWRKTAIGAEGVPESGDACQSLEVALRRGFGRPQLRRLAPSGVLSGGVV